MAGVLEIVDTGASLQPFSFRRMACLGGQLVLQAIVGADIEITFQQGIDRVVEVFFRLFHVARLVVRQSGLILLLGLIHAIPPVVRSRRCGRWSCAAAVSSGTP